MAVSTSEIRRGESVALTPQGEPPQHEMALGLKYLYALEHAGGLPVVVPPLEDECIEPLLDKVAGVCLSGGPDLDPRSYGERRHSLTGPTERRLDSFELALTRAADARGLPILAICRGMQVLNVARGGTLHQHLPDLVGQRVCHRQHQPGVTVTHWVKIESSSRLGRSLVRERVKVNSFHHQAVARLGSGLRTTGHASDGTIESIEAVDRDFVVGVQWHAECLIERPPQAALFREFVDASARFERSAARVARAA
ncbi:MAG: gamma-glutamyl-gamma-aminobutyrate hydrolase family protein [Actinomycetota bacterium]|nr:gamma-glutamyl-gamma-aminobutyrate hydrolase family protein [Actinomycetota bacterium]